MFPNRPRAGFFVPAYDPLTLTYVDFDILDVEALGYRRHLADTSDDEWREVECATDRERRRLAAEHGDRPWRFIFQSPSTPRKRQTPDEGKE